MKNTATAGHPSTDATPGTKRTWRISLGIVVVATLLGVALWPELPQEVAVHFDGSGEATATTLPRPLAVLLTPVLAVGTLGILRLVATVDEPGDDRAFGVAVVGTTAVLGIVHVLVLVENAFGGVPMGLVLPGTLAWAGMLVSYVLYREHVRGSNS